MEALTAREREVLRLTARHLRVREIADALAISPHTVRKHRTNLCAKLGLHGTAQLAVHAQRYSRADPPVWSFPGTRAGVDTARARGCAGRVPRPDR